MHQSGPDTNYPSLYSTLKKEDMQDPKYFEMITKTDALHKLVAHKVNDEWLHPDGSGKEFLKNVAGQEGHFGIRGKASLPWKVCPSP
jgi:hypothetical protein